MSISSITQSVIFVTSHGMEKLEFTNKDRLIDVLVKYHIPWSSITSYLSPHGQGKKVLNITPCLEKNLSQFLRENQSDLFLYFQRNTNPLAFMF